MILFFYLKKRGMPKYIFLSLGNTTLILEVERKMKKIFAVALATVMTLAMSVSAFAATPVYFNDFEDGAGDATIVGSGAIEDDANEKYGKVFHNAVGDATNVRTNYLLLPEDVLSHSVDSKELTIQFWVNLGATGTNDMYSPLFGAYAAEPPATGNSWPMLVLQSRLLAQVNCAGWSDLTADQNLEGGNTEDVTWLDDKEWHLYTVTFDEEIVTIYVDGVVKQKWDASTDYGTNTDTTVAGLYSNGADLKYICLGGNQAWNWGDPDADYLFDDVAIYNVALSADDIADVMEAKTAEASDTEDATETGDMTAVLPVTILAVAAMAVVVVMRKRTVAE